MSLFIGVILHEIHLDFTAIPYNSFDSIGEGYIIIADEEVGVLHVYEIHTGTECGMIGNRDLDMKDDQTILGVSVSQDQDLLTVATGYEDSVEKLEVFKVSTCTL